MNTEQLKRPDIAQAIHDAAMSGRIDCFDNVARIILSDAFMSIITWEIAHHSHKDGFWWGWLRTFEGRTYMLLVAEALS